MVNKKKLKNNIIAILIVLLILLFIYLAYLFYSLTQTTENTTNINAAVEKGNCEKLGCSSEDIYVGSVNSDKYYDCNCRYAKTIKPENIICFENDSEALAENRTKSDC